VLPGDWPNEEEANDMREVGEPVNEPECSREWLPLTGWWTRLPYDVLWLGDDEPEMLVRLNGGDASQCLAVPAAL
jgi:hypothetical protein